MADNTAFQTKRRVEFRDTDAAGIVHFSVFFAYMEEAEHQLLRESGLSVVSQIDDRTISWPRVAAKCDYRRSIKFEQIVTIDVSIERLGSKSITWRFHFRDESGETVADRSTTTVCCEIPQKSDLHAPLKPLPIEIPDSFREKLMVYEAASSRSSS